MRAPPDSPLFPYTTLFRSRVVFGEQIEIAIAALGVPRERVAAVLGVHCGAPTVVVVVERGEIDAAAMRPVIALHAGDARAILVAAPAGTIPRTTSGKPKRRQLWQSFA